MLKDTRQRWLGLRAKYMPARIKMIHTKVERGKDIEKHVRIGYDIFSEKYSSASEYFLVYHCAKAFKCSHMAGTVYKYRGEEGRDVIGKYLDEALQSLAVLRDMASKINMQKMGQLVEDYTRIRQSL